MNDKRPEERLEDLGLAGLKILQNPDAFCFGIDAVLLAWYAAKSVTRKKRVIDLGTGTGVIPLLLYGRTGCTHIEAIELQQDMAEMADRSIALNGLKNEIRIIHGDLRTLRDYYASSSADVVTSNPPYMPAGKNTRNPNTALAIARHEITCTLDDIAAFSEKVLKDRGKLFLVHRAERTADIAATLRNHGLEIKRLRPVYPSPGKAANLILIEAMKKGKPGLIFEPPLVVYKAPNVYSDEINAIYGTDGPQKRDKKSEARS